MIRKSCAFVLLLLVPALGQQEQKKTLVRGPYLQNVTPTSIVVRFQTTESSPGVVEYGAGGKIDQKATDSETQAHAVELKDLKPATKYQYRVNGVTGAFVTAPSGDAPFTFVVYGDCRTQNNIHEKIAAQMAKANPAFVVNSGDLVENGRRVEQWTKYFEIMGGVLKNAPLFPALGNHDARGQAEYLSCFTLPGGGKDWYSFDYGAVHFTVLNMNYGPRKDPKQIDWAKDDLSKSKAPVKFVVYHHPAFSASSAPDRLKDQQDVYATWGKIFEERKVTAALQGHNHNYQRAEKNGILYITTGGGGAPLYPLGALLPETKFARSAYHFIVVSVEAKKTSFRVIDDNGADLETFTIPRGKEY